MSDLQTMLADIEREARLCRRYTGKEVLEERVMAAMKRVPRHRFLPENMLYHAYRNGPVPIGLGQTISQPFIVALMTDLLDVDSNDTVLEIGTGSGYQSAVLAELVEQVYSVEILEPLSRKAYSLLKELGYRNVAMRVGDGHKGWPEHKPYDGIIVTAAAATVPGPLLEQLRPGARLVIPVGLPYSYQELKVYEKPENGKASAKTILGVSFVPLVGGER